MSPPKLKTSRVPMAPGADPQGYLNSLHASLYTNPKNFTPSTTGLTGVTSISGVMVESGRHVTISITIKGNVTASGAKVETPSSPLVAANLTAVRQSNPPVDLGSCPIDTDGIVSLQNFSAISDPILISGIVTEA